MRCFSSYIFFCLIFNVTLCATNNSIHININHNHNRNTTYSPRQMLKCLVGWLADFTWHTGSKSRKGGYNYDSNDIGDDDPENTSKRKGNIHFLFSGAVFFHRIFLFLEFLISVVFPFTSCTLLLMYDLNNFAFSL